MFVLRRPWIGSHLLDRTGAFVAVLCAIHCAAVPLVLATMPSVTLALLSWKDPHHRAAMWLLRASRWEWLVVAFALGFAATSLALGFARHRRLHPALLLVLAALLFAVAIGSPLSIVPGWHAGFAVLGGAALAAAHVTNLRALRARPAPLVSASGDRAGGRIPAAARAPATRP
ncbi:MAG TPA: MerC domain-containing protein [Dokdonella sp.]